MNRLKFPVYKPSVRICGIKRGFLRMTEQVCVAMLTCFFFFLGVDEVLYSSPCTMVTLSQYINNEPLKIDTFIIKVYIFL
jgi:hypothetical protein